MKNKQKTLYEQCYQVSILPNMFCALVLLSYSILIINVDVRKYWGFVLVVIVMILIAQFVLCPITHRMFIGKASRQIEEMEKREFSVEERTKLFLMLHKIPKYERISTLIYFFISANLLFCGFHFLLKVNLYISLAALFACYFGTYIAGLLGFNYTKKVCSKYGAA